MLNHGGLHDNDSSKNEQNCLSCRPLRVLILFWTFIPGRPSEKETDI